MRAPMYRQRPSTIALFSAILVLGLGALICVGLKGRIDAGEADSASMLLVICMSAGIAGALLIAAFARYQFTHLWRSTGARHSDKYKKTTFRKTRPVRG